jgi:flagella basal body P-ring formation protein FlgA
VLVETKRKYLALSKPLKVGAVIEEGDVVVVESDWGSLLEQTIETFEQAVGKTLTRSLLAGAPITLNSLRQTSVIRGGDRVRVLMVGVSQGNAAIGDQVKVKMNNGQSITAVVVKVGVVQVNVE